MNKSESIVAISKALIKSQTDFENTLKTKEGVYNNKYAPLDAIIDQVKPILQKHGLAIVQGSSECDRGIAIDTMLVHDSGEWIESHLVMPVSANDPQKAGASITYGRRYALSAILNIASEDDDDAQSAVPAVTKDNDVMERAMSGTACVECGAPMVKSTKGNWYCQAKCWLSK